MNDALKTLSSSGTIWALVAALLALLSVAISALVVMVLQLFKKNTKVDEVRAQADAEREKKYNEFMASFTASLNAVTANLQASRTDSLAEIRDTRSSLLSGIRDVIWLSHKDAAQERKDLIELAVEKLSGEITGSANSIRASTEKLATTFEKQIDCAEKQRLLEDKRRLLEENDELSRPHNVDPAAPRKMR